MPIPRASKDHPRLESALRQAHEHYLIEGQKQALELALQGAPLAEILDVMVRAVEGSSVNGVLASFLLFDPHIGCLKHAAAPSLPSRYTEAIDGIAIGPRAGSFGTAAYTRETVIVADIQHDPLWADQKALALEHGLRACWAKPVLASTGEVLGTFALYHRGPTTPSQRDVETVELLAQTASLIIESQLEVHRQTEAVDKSRAASEREIARLREMFEHAPAVIAVVSGPQHTFQYANALHRITSGIEDIEGRTFLEAFPELGAIVDLLDTVRATGVARNGRAMPAKLRRGAEGRLEEGYFDFVYQPIEADGDGADSILIMAFEVTDLVNARIAAESAQLRAEQSERDLKVFIDNLPDLAWTARPDGHIDYYNRRWYEYTGTTFEEMSGWGWEKVHDPALLPLVLQNWKRAIETGDPFEMEFTLRGADGISRWFLTRVAATRDSQGNVVRWFGTNTNIDDSRSRHAMSTAMLEQSREMELVAQELRNGKDQAERRVRQLESELASRSPLPTKTQARTRI